MKPTASSIRIAQRRAQRESLPPMDSIVGPAEVPAWLAARSGEPESSQFARAEWVGSLSRLWSSSSMVPFVRGLQPEAAIAVMAYHNPSDRARAWFDSQEPAVRDRIISEIDERIGLLWSQLQDLRREIDRHGSPGTSAALSWVERRDEVESAVSVLSGEEWTERREVLCRLDGIAKQCLAKELKSPLALQRPRLASAAAQDCCSWWALALDAADDNQWVRSMDLPW